MKILIATVIIFTVLLGFSVFAYYYIDHTSGTLAAQVESIEKPAAAKEWSQADLSFSRLNSSWNQISSKWTVLIDHQELDTINITMARIKEFMKTKDLPGSLSELAELKLLFKHIPEKEALNLRNIL